MLLPNFRSSARSTFAQSHLPCNGGSGFNWELRIGRNETLRRMPCDSSGIKLRFIDWIFGFFNSQSVRRC